MTPSSLLTRSRRKNKRAATFWGLLGFKLIAAPISASRTLTHAHSFTYFYLCSSGCDCGRPVSGPNFSGVGSAASYAYSYAFTITYSVRGDSNTISDAETHSNTDALVSAYSQADAVSIAQPQAVAQ